MNPHNLPLKTDSYKITHGAMLPDGTEGVYSYFEARSGAKFDETVFFGLQSVLLEHLVGTVVTRKDVEDAAKLLRVHFGRDLLNESGWMHIVNDHEGKLPLRIRAVPEGMPVPVDNVLMTVENTCPECFWLTNYMETILTHVWYPSTVATQSREVAKMIARYLDVTAESRDGLAFMLHDFGFRGTSSLGSAAIGGAGHLVNFWGSDTLPALSLAISDYDADRESLAFSVPASEHSVMTSLGPDGELHIVDSLIDKFPTGILSVVADSYNYYNFVEIFVGAVLRNKILARTNPDGSPGVFVVRPDSTTAEHPRPEDLVVWTLESLWDHFSGDTNSKGYRVLDPHVRVLWGDGIDIDGINRILLLAMQAGFSAENLVFGMGGGLLQKVNRDTQRFAFKSSAQKRDGVWSDVFKRPLDITKASKRGKLALIDLDGKPTTVSNSQSMEGDLLEDVFLNGDLVRRMDFNTVRANAALSVSDFATPSLSA